MAERVVDGFFYGLFMDVDVLRGLGVAPVDPRRAFVDGFALHIGRRATLVPTSGARSYGVVLGLTHDELHRLYTAPGLEDYRAEPVLARCLGADPVPALCYNLPAAPHPGEADGGYAGRLKEVLTRLGFPSDYVDSVGS